jgi:hypothetical protein
MARFVFFRGCMTFKVASCLPKAVHTAPLIKIHNTSININRAVEFIQEVRRHIRPMTFALCQRIRHLNTHTQCVFLGAISLAALATAYIVHVASWVHACEGLGRGK